MAPSRQKIYWSMVAHPAASWVQMEPGISKYTSQAPEVAGGCTLPALAHPRALRWWRGCIASSSSCTWGFASFV